MQSISAIAAGKTSHQEPYQHSHVSSVQENSHHTHQDNEQHNDDADHPDCHANHCHHSNLVYLELSSKVHLPIEAAKQVLDRTKFFNSLAVTPDLRPPIV